MGMEGVNMEVLNEEQRRVHAIASHMSQLHKNLRSLQLAIHTPPDLSKTAAVNGSKRSGDQGVIDYMSRNPSSLQVQRTGCSLFNKVAASSSFSVDLATEALKTLRAAMGLHFHHALLQRDACSAMSSVLAACSPEINRWDVAVKVSSTRAAPTPI